MGDAHATIALSNPRRPELDPLPVSARADSGALMLRIPAALAALQVQQESIREGAEADPQASDTVEARHIRILVRIRNTENNKNIEIY